MSEGIKIAGLVGIFINYECAEIELHGQFYTALFFHC